MNYHTNVSHITTNEHKKAKKISRNELFGNVADEYALCLPKISLITTFSPNKMTVKCFLLCHYIHQKLRLVENVNIIHK